jgi:hypothetical protein
MKIYEGKTCVGRETHARQPVFEADPLDPIPDKLLALESLGLRRLSRPCEPLLNEYSA